MLSVGKNPGPNSTMLPWTTFYIPNYSKSTNRDYILSVVGYGSAMNSTVVEDEFSELFGFCNKYEATITFESKNYEQSTKVYPTVELDNKTKPYFSIKLPELNNPCYAACGSDGLYGIQESFGKRRRTKSLWQTLTHYFDNRRNTSKLCCI